MIENKLIDMEGISITEVQEKIKKLENDTKVLNKLHLIMDVYYGTSVKHAAEKIGLTAKTGYNWIQQWNEDKFDGLKRKKGSKGQSKLSEIEFLILDLEIQKRNLKTGKQVRDLIKELFQVEYSLRQIPRIMDKLDYTYTKPYKIYTKMPETAKDNLKKTSDT